MLSLLLTVFLGCEEETDPTYELFNASDASVEIEVGAEALLPATSLTLMSNTESVEVGAATVDPGGGPIGTFHTVRVEVMDDYVSAVDKVQIQTSSPGRGEDTYSLTRDSTGQGIWVFELESVGAEGEARTDTFTFRLLTEVE